MACGGFSYGDVLGAGEGWAKSILFNERLREAFSAFFARDDSFTLGVCNGCQMVSTLKELIPGAAHWPRFVRNRSEQFEARLALVRIDPGPSILLAGMAGSHLPIAVAHGEGRAEFADAQAQAACEASGTVALRFLANDLAVASRYPANPNGSPAGTRRAHQPGWPGDDHDAPSRAGLSHGAAFLGAAAVGRGRRLDAPLPQRQALAGLAWYCRNREPNRPALWPGVVSL